MRSKHVQVTVNLDLIRSRAEAIQAKTHVPLRAVVKADAYGLGASEVADALAGAVHEFAYFSLEEALEVGRPGIVLGPPEGEPSRYAELGLRPSIATHEDAQRYGGLPCALSLDSGMQRFGCTPESMLELVRHCDVRDVWSHCANLEALRRLDSATRGLGLPRHGAASALLDQPEAWLEGVRPGVALYRGTVRVTTTIRVARDTTGPAGYSGFNCPRVGVLCVGYSNGIRAAQVLVNGRRQRMLEVGMNCTFISLDRADRTGDEVVLLGDGLSELEIAGQIGAREHEVLCRYGGMGIRRYARAGEMLNSEARNARGDAKVRAAKVDRESDR